MSTVYYVVHPDTFDDGITLSGTITLIGYIIIGGKLEKLCSVETTLEDVDFDEVLGEWVKENAEFEDSVVIKQI